MKGTKTEENNAKKANMTNRRDTRAKDKESEKIHGKSVKKRERTTRENDDIFEIGKYRVGKKKSREKEK